MAATRTFSIIKPDATRRNLTGAVTKMLEEAGLRVVASKRIHMTRDQAEGFYAVHKERPFFNDLCTFMTSGPVVVQVLEGENAVQRNRDVMGATNPATCRRRHDPQALRRIDRGQFGPRFGQRRECEDRDRLLLQAGRDRRLTAEADQPQGAAAEQAAAFPSIADHVGAGGRLVGAGFDIFGYDADAAADACPCRRPRSCRVRIRRRLRSARHRCPTSIGVAPSDRDRQRLKCVARPRPGVISQLRPSFRAFPRSVKRNGLALLDDGRRPLSFAAVLPR